MITSIPNENELYSLQIKIKKNDINKKNLQNKKKKLYLSKCH